MVMSRGLGGGANRKRPFAIAAEAPAIRYWTINSIELDFCVTFVFGSVTLHWRIKSFPSGARERIRRGLSRMPDAGTRPLSKLRSFKTRLSTRMPGCGCTVGVLPRSSRVATPEAARELEVTKSLRPQRPSGGAPADEHRLQLQRARVERDDVGAQARRERAELVLEAERFRGSLRGHRQRFLDADDSLAHELLHHLELAHRGAGEPRLAPLLVAEVRRAAAPRAPAGAAA